MLKLLIILLTYLWIFSRRFTWFSGQQIECAKKLFWKKGKSFHYRFIFSTSAFISTWNVFISSLKLPPWVVSDTPGVMAGLSVRQKWLGWGGGEGCQSRKVICSVTPAPNLSSQVITPLFWQPRLWSDKWPLRSATPMPSPLVLDKIEDELEMTMVCHRPEGLEQLEAQTNFTKRELQVLYRGFKNVRPTGHMKAQAGFPIWSKGLPNANGAHQKVFHMCSCKRKANSMKGTWKQDHLAIKKDSRQEWGNLHRWETGQ